jgi:mannitol-1-/sugar-/sorbitol-6-/2-deoxyglucose-6-phosphatase
MTIKAVIFDMDGVLVDSEVYWAKSRIEFAQDRNKEWTDDLQRLAMGQSTVGWATVMKETLSLDESVDDIIAEMKERVIAHYELKMPTRPGAIESVKHMKEYYRIGLASGSPTEIIKAVLRITELDQIFEVIIYGDDIPRGKPAPDIYLEAMKQLSVTPDVTVGIEDSSNGIRSVKAAGMYSVAAPSPDFPLSDEILAMVDAHITTLEDFTHDLIGKIGI